MVPGVPPSRSRITSARPVRTPLSGCNSNGRSVTQTRNPHDFSLWMAGGGLKPGLDFGDTDELGYTALDSHKVTHSDVHATILHLLGLDFKRLTFEYEGRAESLIGVNPARVITEVLS